MTRFQLLLVVSWSALAVYTTMVIAGHGLGLLPIFFGDIARLGWPGQFNLDFLCFLLLSALWTAWRNGFTPLGWALAAAALFGGAGFLLPYLLFLTYRTRGDMSALLLGRWAMQGSVERGPIPH